MFEITDKLMETIKDFYPVFLALVSAIIGYQFSRRSRKNDLFLEQIQNSYEKLYFPMYLSLIRIREHNGEDKLKLINDFFSYYEKDDTYIKLMARSALLENYLTLRSQFFESIVKKDVNAMKPFFKRLEEFYLMIENECWDGHDILYKDYIRQRNLMFTNPLLRIVKEMTVALCSFTTFLLYSCAVIIYFTLWNYIVPMKFIPEWWNFNIDSTAPTK